MITNQDTWRKMIKARTRANDLDALKIYFAIRVNARWNDQLTRRQP